MHWIVVFANLTHFRLGGSIGSACAVLTFYPLERVRVELQNNSSSVGTTQPAEQEVEIDNEQNVSVSNKDELVMIPSVSNTTRCEETYTKGSNHEQTLYEKCPHLVPECPISQPSDASNIKLSSDDTMVNKAQQINTTTTEQSKEHHETKSSESILQCLFRLHKQKSLYNGASHMTTTTMISNFVFFYTLHVCRRSMSYLQHHYKQTSRRQYQEKEIQIRRRGIITLLHQVFQSKMALSLLSSTVAGMINVVLTNPLWVVSLRIMEGKIPQKSTLWLAIQNIAKSEGVHQLWSGTLTSLLLVSNPIIQHFVYEQMRSWLLNRQQKQAYSRGATFPITALTPSQAFLFGVFAKAIATVLTYPLQLAQVLLRLQTKRLESSSIDSNRGVDEQTSRTKGVTYSGTFNCLHHQFCRGGISALFLGMNAKLLQTVLTSAFTFLTYEQTLVFITRIYSAVK